MAAKNIGPTALGRLVGESKQNIDRWAKQERRLMPEDAVKLAPHLDTTATALLLLGGEDEELLELIRIFSQLRSQEHQLALLQQARVLASVLLKPEDDESENG